LATAVEELGGTESAAGIVCNVSSLENVEKLADAASRIFGGVDIWVNNAGITRDATIRKMTEQQFDDVISVHLRGTWNGLKVATGLMREQDRGGSIVNVSSISGKVGNLGQSNYSAAKAGIVGMTKAVAKEVAFKNIRINAIPPGPASSARRCRRPCRRTPATRSSPPCPWAVPVNRRWSPRWSSSSPPACRATSRPPSPRSPAAVTSDRLATALNGVGLGTGT